MVEDAKEGCCDQALTISESGKDATTIPRNGNPRIDLALPPNSASNAGPRQGWPWPSPREGMLETLQHRNRLTSYGVGFRSFTEAYLDSCGLFKDAVIAILAVIAKPERIRLSERTKAGLATARRKGKVLGRRRAVVDQRHDRKQVRGPDQRRAAQAERGLADDGTGLLAGARAGQPAA